MKPKLLFSSVFALMAAAAGLPLTATAASHLDLMGNPEPLSSATRTITITPATKYVNVVEGETVQFVAGNKAFAWDFSNPNIWAVKLNRVAPAGALDHEVIAYVGRNPLHDRP
jgi:hypothetical protein